MRLTKELALDLIKDRVTVETMRMRHKTHTHVAILMKRGKILEVATNSIGSRSKGSGYDAHTIHAERAVLKKIGDTSKLDGAILIVIRISRGKKEVVNSEPCHPCRCHLEKCMKEYGLKSVYYST